MPYQFLQFAIAPEDRAVLHQRIEQRFHKMIELGFQEEVEKLYQREDLHPDLPSIRCVATAKCGNIYVVTMIMKKCLPWHLCDSPISQTTNHLAARLENTSKLAR